MKDAGQSNHASRIHHGLSHCSLAAERLLQAVVDTAQVSFPTIEPIKPETGVLPGLDYLCHSLKCFLIVKLVVCSLLLMHLSLLCRSFEGRSSA